MGSASVRYIVTDVDAAIEFYTRHLGFELVSRPAPSFAIVAGAGLQIMLSAPGGPGGGGQPMADGRVPEPGGWNRIQIEVDDLRARVDELRAAGVPFRTDAIIEGRGANQILIDDPSGNPVELFERLG